MRTFTSLSVFLTASALFVAGSLLVAPESVSAQTANQPPVITLIGDNPMNVVQFSSFVDPGATAVDNEDETATTIFSEDSVNVNTYEVRSYILTYTAYDSAQLPASTTRIVNITDGSMPFSEITSPASDAVIEDYFITIYGTTTDNMRTASATLSFAPYLADGDYYYCGEYTDIVTLTNPGETSVFNWTYNWTPAENGVFCLVALGTDSSGNNERSPEVQTTNISFTRRIDPEPQPTPPAPEPPTPPSRSGGRRHSTGGGEVLGASTSTAPEAPQIAINTVQAETIGTVDIVWNTNVPATSQVIYGSTANGPYRLGPDKVNFGYTSATAEDSALVMSHKMSLQNIVVGRSYSLRVLSRTSTPTFGPEYRFTLGADGNVKFEGEYGNEIIMGGSINKMPTLVDFVKENQDKINLLFGN